MLNNQSGSDDRIVPRYVFEERIRIGVERHDRKFVTDGWARDLSESGLGAFVAFRLVLDEHVILEVPLALSAKLMLPAKVARCLGTEYGFRFTALSAAQRDLIRSAVLGHTEIPFPNEVCAPDFAVVLKGKTAERSRLSVSGSGFWTAPSKDGT